MLILVVSLSSIHLRLVHFCSHLLSSTTNRYYTYKFHIFSIFVTRYENCLISVLQMLKWRAHNILGSSDFLGNPAALASDVSEGVSGLILEGNVKTLVKNVAHGISNSTAKFTGIENK